MNLTEFPETRESLILNIKDPSNRLAWEQFVDLYRPVILRTILAKGLQHADAQDLTQQILLAVASSIDRWEKTNQSTRFRHWLRRVTSNAIINALTRRPPDRATGASWSSELLAQCPSDPQTEATLTLEYRRELYLRASKVVRAEIAPETWAAFEMTVVQGKEKSVAAKELGKSLGTIYASRSRVIKRLREAVSQLEEMSR